MKNFHAFVITFFKIECFKNSFRNTIRVSISLDSDQDRHFVGPDLGPNCLGNQQMTKVPVSIERVTAVVRLHRLVRAFTG